jgi:predicted permease
MQSLKFACRQVVLHPWLSGAVVLVLAVGISTTTAALSVFYQVVLRPIAAPEPERLVDLSETKGTTAGVLICSPAGFCDISSAFSYPMFRDLEARQSSFTGIAAQFGFRANVARESEALAGRGMLVSGSYFGVLAIQPAVGRLIGPVDEPNVGESAVAVLSYDFWQNEFGGASDVVGRTLTVNGQLLTVIGVTPQGFYGTTLGWRPQVYVPLTMRWAMEPTAMEDEADRRSFWLSVFARLNPDTSLVQAQASMEAVYSAILSDTELGQQQAMSEDQRVSLLERRLFLQSNPQGQSAARLDATQPLSLLLAATGLLLLIVCINVSNLLFARGVSRAGEMAVRTSMGASRVRLITQLAIEAAVLASIGALASVPILAFTVWSIDALIPRGLANEISIAPDWATTMFAMAVTAIALATSASLPAWHTSAANPERIMKASSANYVGTLRGKRVRAFLSTAQIALSLTLLVVAGLFFVSLANVSRVDLGINPASLVTFSVSPQPSRYSSEQSELLYLRIREALEAEPGILGASAADVPILANGGWNLGMTLSGVEVPEEVDNGVLMNSIRPGLLGVLQLPLLSGREFTERDTGDSPPVAIVNESFLRRFSLGSPQSAVGRYIRFTFLDTPIEIVGVAADAKYRSVKGPIEPTFYGANTQFAGSNFSTGGYVFYVRADGSMDSALRAIPRVIASIDAGLPVSNLRSMEEQIRENIYSDRLVTTLTAAVASLATLLAAFGLYAVLAFNIAQRTGEMGLRIALGAQPRDLTGLVVRPACWLTLIGIATGLIGALVAGSVIESLLFGVTGHDPLVFVAAALIVVVVVAAATYLPARYASRFSPMEALRYQ